MSKKEAHDSKVIWSNAEGTLELISNEDGQLCLLNKKKGFAVIPFGYYDDILCDDTNKDIVVKRDDRYGLVNQDGEVLVPVMYSSPEIVLLTVGNDNLYRVPFGEFWGVYDAKSKEEIFPCLCYELFMKKPEAIKPDELKSIEDVEVYFDVRAKYEAAIAKARVNYAEKDEEVEKYLEEYRALMAELIEAKTKLLVERQKELEASKKLKDAKDGAIGVIDSILNNFNKVDGGLNV